MADSEALTKQEEFEKRVISTVQQHIYPEVDGFYYWTGDPDGVVGSAELRIIADYIDKLNEPKIKSEIG